MASASYTDQDDNKTHLKKNKVRKPIIEKMRRDRINHSIEQLRVLLEREIQNHHQHSKLEKADILEMAVNYFQQQKMHHRNDVQNAQDLYYQGYYMCLKETVEFLHSHGHTQGKILHQLCKQKSQSPEERSLGHPESSLRGPTCHSMEGHRDLWRPW
ncbi:transcription factor HES-5-like [Hyperolius riggenbachi]|uniref:transcription factor HES-5-like n=1 Tax=Hyperolius riggenbachi TaxID=752182 RepID=UPI0035A39DF8